MTRPAAVSLAAFLALALAGTALAQSQVDPAPSPAPAPGARPDTPPPATQQYKAMDRNSDGLVSTGEFEDVARSMFDAMDADKDDNVTLEEMQAALEFLESQTQLYAAEAMPEDQLWKVTADGRKQYLMELQQKQQQQRRQIILNIVCAPFIIINN